LKYVTIPASILESREYYNASAGLLTCSPPAAFPLINRQTVAIELPLVMELTAAGQSRIYTVFPFNSGKESSLQKPKALQM
jgi:hypothetical protein